MAYKHFRDLGFTSYKDYLRSSLWKKTKLKLRGGSDGSEVRQCEICKRKCLTQVHHKTYKRIGNEKKKDLVEVCGRCHKNIHVLASSGMGVYSASQSLQSTKGKLGRKTKLHIRAKRMKETKREERLNKPKDILIRQEKLTGSEWVHALPWNL